MKRRNGGFTLIRLLVVIAIIIISRHVLRPGEPVKTRRIRNASNLKQIDWP